jgi:cell division protease FtsH
LIKYRSKLDEVAAKLLETETMSREEFEAIFPLPKPKNHGIPKLATK